MADDAPTTEATDAPEPAAPAFSDGAVALLERVRAAFPAGSIIEAAEATGTVVVRVTNESWGQLAKVCRQQLGFDYLSFISGIDWLPAPTPGGDDAAGDTSSPTQPKEQTPGVAGAAGRFQVFAHVEDTRTPRSGLTLKVDLEDAAPSVASWVATYPGADWHERECWEMFGVEFVGHPALRHIYLPIDFEGHPLRKDFPLLAREVKPWPGLVDVEAMPGGDDEGEGE